MPNSNVKKTCIALTIAGTDSSGGAGIQADLKTFSALGVYGASVIAALTAQNTQGVQAVLPIAADFIAKQISACADDLAIDAVKIGMLGDSATIVAVADGLRQFALKNIVLDPVMVAKSGDQLLEESAVATLAAQMLPLADLITPNLPEAAVLLGSSEVACDRDSMLQVGRQLLQLGARAVLLKGGHLSQNYSDDLLIDQHGNSHWFAAERLSLPNTHGTGCTLSSAIGANLAKGEPMLAAVGHAKDYITKAIAASKDLKVGKGIGPVQHFHAWW